MLIRFNSVPESVGKSNGRSGDWKFLFFGISKKSGYVQLFLLVIFYLIFFLVYIVHIGIVFNNMWSVMAVS